jgi:alpha-glucosidase
MTAARRVWWRDGVLYQIYPRSFADSNGDGVGDLRGIIERLDHLEWLGIDGIWLNPVTSSPNKDWGYDVSDYKAIDPALGTLEDSDELIREASARGIRVLYDLVPNHTSDQHPWFQDALSGRDSSHRHYYVWADPKEDGSPPNNWLSVFGGEGAWELDEHSGQYYLHNFLRHQPDLNWWNDEVRDEFDDILRFWFDRGVAGFRIDVAHSMIKDKELRDNLPATDDDPERVRRVGQQPIYNMNRPEGHDVIRRWRSLSDEYDPQRILVGETFVLDVAKMVSYYGEGDELNLAFNFPFMFSHFESSELRGVVELTESLLPEESWPVWTASNHDVGRLATRWCGGDERKARCALMLLLTMRGTPFLYYGDEIGLEEVEIQREDVRDPVGERFWPKNKGRDPGRTPMAWSPEPGAGFSRPGVRPWLPYGDHGACNVADQRGNEGSVLWFTKDLIALRKRSEELIGGSYETVATEGGLWAYRRGARTLVALNLSDEPTRLEQLSGIVAISTDRSKDGDEFEGGIELQPWQGAVVLTSQ